jgi:ABC-type phosphate transport system substrate-binding protein
MNHRKSRGAGAALLFGMALALCLGGTVAFAADDGLVVIANPGISLESIESKDLQRIYLGKKTMWEDGTSIVTVMTKNGSVHDRFIEDFLDRSVQRFATYWRQMVFTGKGVPPRSFVQEADLVSFVASTPGSLGFASVGADMSGVKVITVE